MIRTTLKENKDRGIDYIDIAYYCDENWYLVADLFENSEKYYWNGHTDHTDFDKLYEDYTERQVASRVLKELRKEKHLLQWNNYFIDLDCDGEIAYDQLKELIEEGVITGSNQLEEIESKAKRRAGVTIRKGTRYGENDIYFKYLYVSNLIDKYFPCQFDEEEGCMNCHNCQ